MLLWTWLSIDSMEYMRRYVYWASWKSKVYWDKIGGRSKLSSIYCWTKGEPKTDKLRSTMSRWTIWVVLASGKPWTKICIKFIQNLLPYPFYLTFLNLVSVDPLQIRLSPAMWILLQPMANFFQNVLWYGPYESRIDRSAMIVITGDSLFSFFALNAIPYGFTCFSPCK